MRRVEPSGFTRVSALGVEEQRVNVLIDLVEPPREGLLGDGFRVLATVVLWRSEEALRVPVAALFRREGQWHCFAVREGSATTVALEVGHQGAGFAEVLGGLSEGEEVVVHPPMELTDGRTVAAAST